MSSNSDASDHGRKDKRLLKEWGSSSASDNFCDRENDNGNSLVLPNREKDAFTREEVDSE